MDSHPINNFKGVMLCERPAENAHNNNGWTEVSKTNGRSGNGTQPFLTACAYDGDPVGLPPCNKVLERGKPRKLPALQQHLKWLAAYSSRILQKNNSHEEGERSQEKQRTRVKEFSASLRAAICEGKDVSAWKPVMETCKWSCGPQEETAATSMGNENHGGPSTGTLVRKPQAEVGDGAVQKVREGEEAKTRTRQEPEMDLAMASFVNSAVAAALANAGSPPPSTRKEWEAEMVAFVDEVMEKAASCEGGGKDRGGSANSGGARGTRPKWALTERQVEKHEEKEEEELLEFASALDYQQFMEGEDERLDGALLESVERCQLSLEQQQQQQQQHSLIAPSDTDRPGTNLRTDMETMATKRPALLGISPNDVRERPSRPMTADTMSSQCSEKSETATTEGSAWKAAQEIRRKNYNIRNIHSSASVRSILEREDLLSSTQDGNACLRQTLSTVQESTMGPVCTK